MSPVVRRHDDGSATVLVLAAAGVLALVASLLACLGAVAVARHRAAAAADQAALAAAARVLQGPVAACGTATAVARHHSAALVSCDVLGEVVDVVVELPVGSVGTVRGRARAGPAGAPGDPARWRGTGIAWSASFSPGRVLRRNLTVRTRVVTRVVLLWPHAAAHPLRATAGPRPPGRHAGRPSQTRSPPAMDPSFVSPPVERPRRLGALIGDSLRRPGGRRVLSLLSVVLLLAGVGMFAYPVGTDLFSKYKQSQLTDAFDSAETREAYLNRSIAIGKGLTKLKIDKIDAEVLVVEGTTPAALRAGAGHYVGTPLPGEVGNVGIAGHRTTYGRPLNRMDELAPGDLATLETPLAVHTYRAVGAFDGHANPFVVAPSESDVLLPRGDKRLLTLTTCHPKGSARQRLIMTFELVKTVDKPGKSLPRKPVDR